MTTLVLNEETAKTPLGEMLSTASDSEIEIWDEQGEIVARVLLSTKADASPPVEFTEEEIEELRRRRNSDPSNDITTKELLAYLHSLTEEYSDRE